MSAPKVQIMPIRRRLVPPPSKSKRKSPTPQSRDTSEDSPQKTVRRTRAGKPKVKTGCLTCKIRRIKCDETKPACLKCSSTGRKCDGYVPVPSKVSHGGSRVELVLYQTVSVDQGSPAERRALDFFRTRTAPALASYFDAEFWSRVVLQMGHSEPVIRHAMIAVGTLYERRDFNARICKEVYKVREGAIAPNIPSTEIDAGVGRPVVTFMRYGEEHSHPFALLQYNKAISHLAQRMSDVSPQSADIALLACLLFVCIEFLRSNDNLAIQHFNSGKCIALEAASQPGTLSGLRKHLLPFFYRLELLFMLFGNQPTWPHPITVAEAVPSAFTSLQEARDSVMHLMVKSVRFIRQAADKKYSNAITPSDRQGQLELLSGFDAWKASFDAFSSFSELNLSLKEMRAATLLDILRLTTVTWLKRSLSPLESATDEDNPLYEQAVSLAEMMQSPPSPMESCDRVSPQTAPAYFLFDMELVSPMYMVAIKCRHPTTRRRAITLLQSQVRREGLWDSNVAAAVATRIVEIEEQGMRGVLDGSVLPAERMRVHNAQIAHKEGPLSNVHIEFWTFPIGTSPEGEWVGGVKRWKEVIVMEI